MLFEYYFITFQSFQSVNVILDPSTAHPCLILSQDRKKVRCGDRYKLFPTTQSTLIVWCVCAGLRGLHPWSALRKMEVVGKTDQDWDYLFFTNPCTNKLGNVALIIIPVLLPV